MKPSPALLSTIAIASLVTPTFAVVNIDYAAVGNAGNVADPATGSLYGAVGYAYQIARNETTINQYAEFLNAVAQTDTYGLYNPSMSSDARTAGITQTGGPGTFSYSVVEGSGNKPITFVNWYDAARFTNWMHNGQPTGAQNAATTEDGAYTLNGAINGVSISRNIGATVWIPSENEWYKAAYYDPNKGGEGVGGYWTHATQSDTIGGNSIGVASSANYFDGDHVGSGNATIPVNNALTDVGAYGASSASAYGTNDQAGNVWEWNGAVVGSDDVFGAGRGLRGGSWIDNSSFLPSSSSLFTTPTNQEVSIGFRVASIPEPSVFILALFSGAAMLANRRRI